MMRPWLASTQELPASAIQVLGLGVPRLLDYLKA